MAVYYETSWSILSTIGLANFFFAWIVVGVTKLTFLSAVPIVVSAASAVANGLCYYAWYMDSGKASTASAYAVADILWMVSRSSWGPASLGSLTDTHIKGPRGWAVFL